MALYSTLQKFITKEGAPVEGASVNVKLSGGAVDAELFATRTGTAKGNPFLTTANGEALCYVKAGRYDMTVTKGTDQIVFKDIEVGPVSNVGTFAEGGTITDPDQLVEDADGNKWRWTGNLNYTFSAGENPEINPEWVKYIGGKYASVIALLEQWGYSYKGTFAKGFTYSQEKDAGIDENGKAWIYVGAGAPNKAVSAGTVPSAGAGYERITFNAASGVIDSRGTNVQDYIDGNLTPFKNVAAMKAATFLSTLPEFTRVEWQGYYSQSDGGSNWGILRFGAHTEDGGSIFSIDSNTYIEANLKGGSINALKFGANVNLDNNSPNVNLIFDYVRATRTILTSFTVKIPSGEFRFLEPINILLNATSGLTLKGAGMNSTTLTWAGEDAGALITNETDGVNNFQYGVFISDMTLLNKEKERLDGTVGMHLEMLQNKSEIARVRISGFDYGMFIGLHAEMLTISNSFLSYNNVAAWGQGDQADLLTFRSVTFSYNVRRGVILSCPRPILDSCHFNYGIVSDPLVYRDIQIGYSKIRPQDVGKSSYATSARGNDGSRARVINTSFEGEGSLPSVLLENIDERHVIVGSDLTFRDCKAALYGREAFIEVVNPYMNVKTRDTQVTTNNPNYSLIIDSNASSGCYSIIEPHLSKIWKNETQLALHGLSDEDYTQMPQIANSMIHSPRWTVSRVGAGITNVNLDYNGEGDILVSYDENLVINTQSVIFNSTQVPAGFSYFNFQIASLDGALFYDMEVRNGDNEVVFFKRRVPTKASFSNLVFGINNPEENKTLTFRLFPIPIGGNSGSFIIKLPTVKHETGGLFSFYAYDTRRDLGVTNRSDQIFDALPKIKSLRIKSNSDESIGSYWCGETLIKTVTSSELLGSTSITLDDINGVGVGMYISVRKSTVNDVSPIHEGKKIDGYKVTAISGNTLSLSNGFLNDVPAGSTVIICSIFQEADSIKL